MAVVNRTVYPISDSALGIPSLHASSGKLVGEPLPLRWLETLVQDIRRHIVAIGGTEAEADSAVVYGAEGLRVQYTDQLTAVEQLREALADRERALTELRGIFRGIDSQDPRLQQIQAILGLPADKRPGVSAPAAGPASVNTPSEGPAPLNDEQRRLAWLDHLERGRWRWQANEQAIRNDAARLGLTADELKAWTPQYKENP